MPGPGGGRADDRLAVRLGKRLKGVAATGGRQRSERCFPRGNAELYVLALARANSSPRGIAANGRLGRRCRKDRSESRAKVGRGESLRNSTGRRRGGRGDLTISVRKNAMVLSMTDAQKTDEPISLGERWLLSIGVAVVVVFVLLACLFASGFVEWVGVAGVGVTILAVFVAGAIYFNQRRSSAASEGRLSRAIEESAAKKVEGDQTDAAAEAEPDRFPSEYADLGAPAPGASNVMQLLPEEVPLQLIRDLVLGWERALEKGSWTIGDLRLVLRRRGKGNHAWWFIFRRPDGDHLLKMSRGGPGNGPDDITVREVGS